MSRPDEAAVPNATSTHNIPPASVPPTTPSARPLEIPALGNSGVASEHNQTGSFAETTSHSTSTSEALPGGSKASWKPSELALVKRWYKLNRLCLEWSFAPQGDENSDHESVAEEPACRKLEDLSERLRQINVCYGKEGQSQADMELHRCGPGSEQL